MFKGVNDYKNYLNIIGRHYFRKTSGKPFHYTRVRFSVFSSDFFFNSLSVKMPLTNDIKILLEILFMKLFLMIFQKCIY